jgi:nucleoside-diphosphate-sugar epimerase
MMFMEDAIRATLDLMEAPAENIKIRSSYNLSGCDFTPEEISDEIRQHIPDFEIEYAPDYRQAIAESWPSSIDDSYARIDWGWKEKYNLKDLVNVMLNNVDVNLLTQH